MARFKLWAVQQISTGYYLPSRDPKTRLNMKGFTSMDPCAPKDAPPRVHNKRVHAHNAMKAWLKGVASKDVLYSSMSDSLYGAPNEIISEKVVYEAPEHPRDPKDFRVIELLCLPERFI